MRRFVLTLLASLLIVIGFSGVAGAQVETLMYDHVHMAVSDPTKAAAWWQEHIGGEFVDDLKERLLFGRTRIMFLRGNEKTQPSAGSAVDHLGFSYPDLGAKLKELEAAGAKIEGPARDVQGLFKLAFAVDPWGTRLELVQDTELLGFHHVHLRAVDPDASYKWYLAQFGGERMPLKGRLDAIRYPGAPYVWLLITKGENRPSRGSAIDHIGWRAIKLDAKVTELKGKSITMETEQRPLKLPNGTIQFAYVVGPDGTRVELVEREAHMK
jgi:catechol 2,3-dioxygenase-like lactoylglutathione lyase family enzyme